MKKALAAVLIGLFCVSGFAAEPKAKKEPPKKVKVTKPCKAGQTEKDGCHVVKKAEPKKKAPAKPKPKPKQDSKKK